MTMKVQYSGQSVVIVDADNTLWDTDSVYAKAQLALLAAAESATSRDAMEGDRLAFVRSLDQALAERHYAGLRYPPRLLARAVALVLTGKSAEVAVRLAWSGGREGAPVQTDIEGRMEAEFIEAIQAVPPLRPGVRTGLSQLQSAGCVVMVLTEGSRERILRTAKSHRLTAFSRVIEAKKDRQLFERVLRLSGHPSETFMVGDQLARDIRPAKEAGLRTIYFPGGFRPRWEPTEAKMRPDYRISNFDEVPGIVLAKGEPRVSQR